MTGVARHVAGEHDVVEDDQHPLRVPTKLKLLVIGLDAG